MNYKKFLYVKIINQKTIYYKYSNKSLLLILESNNLFVENNCRSGYCGLCKATLLSGRIKYLKKKIIGYTSKNEILLCSCKATSNLVIKI
ncbi:2Fe-2S iron-sulfur cluster-binding protein [Buchnera aphidicola (Taiwanaphis decaspermi)]|uniref:2Fe-2S iron-sulfur cluster-binding protein n=1 Tax=Buchnera aphidicola TaxID=9 RepID=UPI0031B824C4